MCTGEVLPVHVEFTEVKLLPEKEENILTMLRKLVSIVPENWIEEVLPVELSDDQRRILADSLKNLKAVIVGAQLTQSIYIYLYSSTLEVLEAVWYLFQSGELADIVQQLCQCLANDASCTVRVGVRHEDYVLCKEELSMSGRLQSYCYLLIKHHDFLFEPI